ncbi:hypothetical protein T439DRAFT_353962 [Meredithblackwellia eburnea MCA 4105]
MWSHHFWHDYNLEIEGDHLTVVADDTTPTRLWNWKVNDQNLMKIVEKCIRSQLSTTFSHPGDQRDMMISRSESSSRHNLDHAFQMSPSLNALANNEGHSIEFRAFDSPFTFPQFREVLERQKSSIRSLEEVQRAITNLISFEYGKDSQFRWDLKELHRDRAGEWSNGESLPHEQTLVTIREGKTKSNQVVFEAVGSIVKPDGSLTIPCMPKPNERMVQYDRESHPDHLAAFVGWFKDSHRKMVRTRWQFLSIDEVESENQSKPIYAECTTVDFVLASRQVAHSVGAGATNELGDAGRGRRCHRVFREGMGYYRRRAADMLK